MRNVARMRTYPFLGSYVITQTPDHKIPSYRRPPKKTSSYRRRPVSIAPQGPCYNLDSGVRPRNDTYEKLRNTNPNNRIFIIGGLIGQSRNTKETQWIPACAGMTTKNNKVPLWRTRKRYRTKRTHRSRRRGPGSPLGCRGGEIIL